MTTPQIDAGTFQHQFGRAGQITFETLNDAIFVRMSCDGGSALVSLQGAQVLGWTHRQHGDMLYWSPASPVIPGKPARGGIPICWPWFGPHPADAKRMHGTVRTKVWTPLASAADPRSATLTLGLASDGARLTLTVSVSERLDVAFSAENLGAAPLTVTEALHTYFAVGDATKVSVGGLDGCSYRDRTADDTVRIQQGAMTCAVETNAHFDVTPDTLRLIDPVLKRYIGIARRGGNSTVVWNPGASAGAIADLSPGGERLYVCVESGNVGTKAITIAPGATHTLGVNYCVQSL